MGDEYRVSPFDSSEHDTDALATPGNARVTAVQPLTSTLEVFTIDFSVRTGCLARPVVQLYHHRYPIRLDHSLPDRAGLQDLLVGRKIQVLDDTSSMLYHLHVKIDDARQYKIHDSQDQLMKNLPALHQDTTSVHYIADIIEHQLRYTMIEELTNNSFEAHDVRFDRSCMVRIHHAGNALPPGSVINIKYDDQAKFAFELEVLNKTDCDAYLHIYDLGPSWQVENALRGNHVVVPARCVRDRVEGVWRKRFKTTVPPEIIDKGIQQCRDIMKVIITSKATSFDMFELPKLGESVARDSSSHFLDASSNRAGSEAGHVMWKAATFYINTLCNA